VASTKIAQQSVTTESSVLWASTAEPPPGMASYLRSEGLALRVREPQSSWPAPRLLSMAAQLPSKLRMLGFGGQRIAVLHSDPAQAATLADALRAHSAEVLVVGRAAGLDRVVLFEPDCVLVDLADFYGSCWQVVHAFWQNARLRWVPVVLTPVAMAAGGQVAVRDLHLLGQTLRELAVHAEQLGVLAQKGEPFEIPLNTLGPARTLRALRATGLSLCVSFTTKRIRIEVDLADHEVVGVRGGSHGRSDRALGSEALDWLYGREHGKVRVYPCDEGVARISSVRELGSTRARSTSIPPPPVADASAPRRTNSVQKLPRLVPPPPSEPAEPPTIRIPTPGDIHSAIAYVRAHQAQLAPAQRRSASVQPRSPLAPGSRRAQPRLELVQRDVSTIRPRETSTLKSLAPAVLARRSPWLAHVVVLAALLVAADVLFTWTFYWEQLWSWLLTVAR
jgi:hypothetical protein